MANPEHLAILKQGVEVWNKWRDENPHILPDLGKSNFRETDLAGINLRFANLHAADLDRAELNVANLSRAFLSECNLSGADMKEASLSHTNLTGADLSGADLTGADLWEANLSFANLGAADLWGANLSHVKLDLANLAYAMFGATIVAHVDLGTVEGIERISHWGPSEISTSTILISQGRLPEKFLHGCGLSNWEIESAKLYNPDLSGQEIDDILYRMHDLRAHQALQISPLFISYSHADSAFVDSIETKLNDKGVRFWRDVHHATAGRLEKQIDLAIRHNLTVLVILSENSTKSDWVEHEVRKARDLEKELNRDVLCPVALDDTWKTARWPARIMEQLMEYNVLDFSGWEDDNKFDIQFKKLIDGLDIFYK